MRFEAKHKDLKLQSQNCRSRVNLPFTLLNRMQLRYTVRYLNKRGLVDYIQWGRVVSETLSNETNPEVFKDFLFMTYYEKNSICYRPSSVIRMENSETLPQFCTIKYVLKKTSDNSCHLYCNKLTTLNYDEHFHAYEVINDKKENVMFLVSELSYIFPLRLHIINTGQMMLSLPKY